jgi:hypothetical protein
MAAAGASATAPAAVDFSYSDDDDDDGGTGGGGVTLPAKALALAARKEMARVSVARAMDTIGVMLTKRGYRVVPGAASGTIGTGADAVDVLLTAEVVPEPPAFTTAWAVGLVPGSRMQVYSVSSVAKAPIRAVTKAMQAAHIPRGIVLYRDKVTAGGKDWIADFKDGAVELFRLDELQAAVVLHEYNTPSHLKPLNADMAAVVRKRYPGAIFPRVPLTDPVARFYALPSGTIIHTVLGTGVSVAEHVFYEVR